MKKVLVSIGRALKSNLLLKIISIFVAILIWLFVMADTNPIRTVTVDNIAVGTHGTEELHAKKLVVSSGDLMELNTIRAQVKVGQQSIDSISHSTVSASVDLSSINAPGEYALNIETTSPVNSTVVSVTPETLIVNVEELVTRDVPVIIETTGEAQHGYYVHTPQITPTLLTVQGAASTVQNISSAICTVDLSEYTDHSTQSKNIELVDSNGNPVDTTGLISDHPSVILSVPVSQVKMASVDTNSAKAAVTNVAEGFEVTSITITPSEIQIVGDNLQDITTLAIENINANGAFESFSVNAQLKEIEGVIYPNGRNVTANIVISEQTSTRIFEEVPIEVENVLSDYEYELDTPTVTLSVSGTLSALSNLDENDVRVVASAQGLFPGTHTVELTVLSPEITDEITEIISTPNGVSITLTEQ